MESHDPRAFRGLRHEMIIRDGKFYAVKWLVPMFFAMFGFYVQSVLLHFATYQYVHRMLQLSDVERNSTFATLVDPISDALSGGVDVTKVDYSQWMGSLDKLAALFPALFVALSLWDLARRLYGIYVKGAKDVDYHGDDHGYWSWPVRTLQTWTKVMLCCGILFILKGVVGAVTTVPDSNGWTTCQNRLKPDGIEWMSQTHTLFDMMGVDWHFNMDEHHPLRYCSDMMFSGHTFVVTLFALGLYEELRIMLSFSDLFLVKKSKNKIKWKIGLLTLLAFVAIGEQSLEIFFVLKTHFHYSSDVMIAIVLTFLMFTNGAITLQAKNWEMHGFGLDVLLPCCEPPADYVDEHNEFELEQMLATRGDIFVPPCCIPFCQAAGREHFYSDLQITKLAKSWKKLKLFEQAAKVLKLEKTINDKVESDLKGKALGTQLSNSDEALEEDHAPFTANEYEMLKHELHLGEGVSMKEFELVAPWAAKMIGNVMDPVRVRKENKAAKATKARENRGLRDHLLPDV